MILHKHGLTWRSWCYSMILRTSTKAPNIDFCYKPYIPWILLTKFFQYRWYVLYIPWILRINLFKPTNPKDELVWISSWVRSMVYMVCNRNYMIDRSMTSKSWNNRPMTSKSWRSYYTIIHFYLDALIQFVT
jgi:hypothetical protein